MASRQWLDHVTTTVLRRGLPAEYVARLAEELRDHVAELEEHEPGATAEARLGAAEAVADTAVREYRAGRFAGRHPILVFLLVPVLAVEFALNVYVHAGIQLVEGIGGMESPFAVGLSHVLTWLCGFVVPVGVLGLLWWVYRRSGRPRAWFAVSGAVVAVLAGLFFAEFTPPNGTAEAELVAEFRFAQSWVQLFQFVAVVGPAVWLARPSRSPLAVS
ncbi:hypothetical protein R5W24_003153 [Gemmata sp. JC717]|uniref:hypothetical protein n=1 Tax=Gemmata algarum TaxID=2975278 RepID=UPI0021BB9322|nr:hypothetical protein [Gemmata algarum]MDY3554036.1 hypothetical protein [Gemmata algarum]